MLGSLVTVAHAAPSNIDDLVRGIADIFLNPLITLLFALALVYFLYGVVVFIANAKSPDKRQEGQRHILWGLVGMFIMFSVFAIMNLLMSTLNVTGIDPDLSNQDIVNLPPAEVTLPN